MKLGIFRRLRGSDAPDAQSRADEAERTVDEARGAAEDAEAARELDLLRADAARLNDPLLQRQLRFADRSWTPPAEGGSRRAGEGDGPSEG